MIAERLFRDFVQVLSNLNLHIMKKLYISLIFCLFTGISFEAAAKIYVNRAATGMNNGSSWENAYAEISLTTIPWSPSLSEPGLVDLPT